MEAGSGRGAYRRGRVVAHRPARSTHGACTRRRGLGLVWTWWPKACTVEHARRGTRRRSPSWRLDDPTDDSSSRIYLTTISMCVASRSSISKLRAPATNQAHRPPRGGRFYLAANISRTDTSALSAGLLLRPRARRCLSSLPRTCSRDHSSIDLMSHMITNSVLVEGSNRAPATPIYATSPRSRWGR